MTSPPSRVRLILEELGRRRVFRTAAVYVVAAFAGLEGAELVVGPLGLPPWTMTFLVVLALVGFPVAVGLAWAFDIERAGARDASGRTARADWAGRLSDGVDEPPGADRRGKAVSPANGPGAGPVPDAPPVTAPPAHNGSPCVAVLPFLNLSGDRENEYFADGVTEDVIAHLSRIRALDVISRTSAMAFKVRDRSLREIAATLGATTLLDGSVRRSGDRVRIVAELIDAATDRHLWTETYDRQLTDIFSIQTDVALHIAHALRAELSVDEHARIRSEPTGSVEAYHLHLKGRHWYIRFTPDSLERAIHYFEQAVAADPTYAMAWSSIAMAYAELAEGGGMPTATARDHATAAAERSLRLDPDLGEAHCAVAHLRAIWRFEWQEAEKGFRRALELCPGSADIHDLYGRMCRSMGRLDEAVGLLRRARDLDPLAHRTDVASALLRTGRYEEAEAEARWAAEFDPEHDRARATLGWALFLQGRHDEGIAEIECAAALSPNAQWRAQLAQAKALAGRVEEARRILLDLESGNGGKPALPYHLAFVYTGLGEHDRALDLLERAFEERMGAVHGIKGSFLFAPLRPHARFQALLGRMNLA